jgi:hypothetical protein
MPDLAGYAVNREGQNEVIWQPAYDYQVYPAAGSTQLTFFQTTVGTGGSTLANTNMRASGQFPSPQEFLCTGIQVFFNPPGVIMQVGTATATAVDNWNDVNNVMQGLGWLEFFIGSKPYLDDAPLSKFTQQFKLGGVAALATGDPAVTYQSLEYATHCGKYYAITPVKIPKNQNFNVTLNFPALIPLTGAEVGRIGVILDGFLYRLSQ